MSNCLENFLRDDYSKWGERNYLYEKKENGFEPITFASYIENVNYLASYFINNGYSGKAIGIYGPNSIEWMISDIAIICYVGLSVGFNKDWSYENIVYSVKKCELSAIIYDERQAETVERLKKEFPEIKFISVQKDFQACLKEGKKSLGELFSLEGREETVPAKVVFTSGTTTFPKAVMLSIKNVFSGWRSLGRRVQVTIEDRCYLFLPLNHTYGSIYNFIYSLVFGYEVFLAGSVKEMAQEMMQIHPTIFCGVPLVFTRFIEGSKAMGVPLAALFGGKMKYCFCGGAKLPAEMRNEYK
jgi:long-subunit acyl-CoA synthetase (AMP-forming)